MRDRKGSTALCRGCIRNWPTYRGYDITDGDNTCFEEVAFLIFHGHLPNQQELDDYRKLLIANRGLPPRYWKC